MADSDAFSRQLWATFCGTLAAILVGATLIWVFYEYRQSQQDTDDYVSRTQREADEQVQRLRKLSR